MKARRMTLLAVLAIAGVQANADVYSWVVWDTPGAGVVTGTINSSNGPVGVTVTGPFVSVLTNYPSYNPASTWADGVLVDNAPDNTSIVRIIDPSTFKIEFDTSVKDLAFTVWSVGQGGNTVTYSFDQNLTFVAGGPSVEFGGISITTTATTLSGTEGSGTVLFEDTFSQLNFSTDPAENWHGFNLGLKYEQPVPEPATFAGLALGALALRRRRK